MFVEFSVKNFLSFKEKHTFSLISTKDKDLSELNTFEADKKLRFLKSAVIYGANASGKSNFFNALSFLRNFSVYSGPRQQVEDPIEIDPFALSKQTESAPSSFEIVFLIKNGSEEIKYRYGLSVSTREVEAEYLYAVYNVREVMLFTRTFQKIGYTSYFKEGARGKFSVRNNCTFLSVCAQNNGEISTQIVKYFKNIAVLYGLYDQTMPPKKENKRTDYKKRIINFLKFADIQITNFKTKRIPAFGDIPDSELSALLRSEFPNLKQHKVLYGHIVYDGEIPTGEKYFDEDLESAGTRKLFSYASVILGALDEGTPLFIDEFDTMLHPLIIEAIVKLFNSSKTNPKNAQLIISCHAINIMKNDLFRRDQIWFCEKDQYGATSLHSLAEYKEPVRKDAS
jgi:AAA15 family ATPase/GTPase